MTNSYQLLPCLTMARWCHHCLQTMVRMGSGGAGAEPSCTRMHGSAKPPRAQFFRIKGCRIGRPNSRSHFSSHEIAGHASGTRIFAPCSSPAGVDEIAERRHSHWLDRKAGKARCSAATKFTGQDGLAKARRVSRTPSSGTRHSLSSLRQQDSLLPSARVHCPASKGLSALSQPFGDLLPPRVSFGAKASSCFPLGARTHTAWVLVFANESRPFSFPASYRQRV
jgi:hypothetical protein